MELAEVRRRFSAYASGDLTQSELRNVIRAALVEEPMLSTAYIALAESYRRANVIDAELQSNIVADITDVTGPYPEARTPRAPPGQPEAHPPRDAADATPGSHAVAAGVAPGRPQPTSPSDGGISDSAIGTGARTGDSAPTRLRSTTGTGPTTGPWIPLEVLEQPTAPLSCGSVLKDRFELLEELGRGGMGVVYRALDRRTAELNDQHCYVAIKVLNDDFKRHPLAVRALQREARKAKSLSHPNIVRVYDFDRDGGAVFLVMELLSGGSLDQLLRSDGSHGLRLPRVKNIVKALGAALSYAHQEGIIHSDFKPSNAYITDEGAVKVLDFGIARAVPASEGSGGRGDHTTFDAATLGAVSPPYASVEMLTGEQPDVRDDVYALALVTYELLTGDHPFNRIDALKALGARLEPQPVRGLSRAQWHALQQGLSLERKDRTPSVETFVTSFLEARRPTVVWWVAGAAVSVVTIGLATFSWFRSSHEVSHGQNAAAVQPATPPHVIAETDGQVAAPNPATSGVTEVAKEHNAPSTLGTGDSAETTRSPEVAQQAAKIQQAPAAPEAGAANPPPQPAEAEALKQPPEAEALKSKFSAQVASGDMQAANATANALRRALGESIYVTRDLPRILIDGYLHLAQSKLAAGDVEGSLQLLAEGRRKFSRDPQLKELEVRYNRVGEIYDQLRTAVSPPNVTEMRDNLQQLRAAEGVDYPVAEQMLARTLGNRIADHRAADRPTVVARLLEAGRAIFPEYAELLERGTAGVLPTEIALPTDAAAATE